MDSKFCIHGVFIELGYHLLEKYFGFHIFTLMESLDILKLHDIMWVQENTKPVKVFLWRWILKQGIKDIGELVLYPIHYPGIYLKYVTAQVLRIWRVASLLHHCIKVF